MLAPSCGVGARHGLAALAAALALVVVITDWTVGHGGQPLHRFGTSATAAGGTSSPSAAVGAGAPGPTVVAPGPPRDPAIAPVVQPVDRGVFTVVVQTRQVGQVPATRPALVSSIDVPSHALVVPPVPASDDWTDTSVWVTASAYPVSPPTGTSYVYGHACLDHICPFTALRINGDGSYTVRNDDQVVVTTATGTLTYVVCGVGSSPKSGDLIVPPCGDLPRDIVLVTCEYVGSESRSNIVVAATLVATATRP